MGSMCGVGAFLLGNDLVVRGSTTSLPPIYTYLQFSQVAGTDIDFLNNHNFWMCTASGHFFLGNDLVVRGSTTSLPPIYTYLQFSQVAGTDIDFLNNHNF